MCIHGEEALAINAAGTHDLLLNVLGTQTSADEHGQVRCRFISHGRRFGFPYRIDHNEVTFQHALDKGLYLVREKIGWRAFEEGKREHKLME